MKAGDRDNRDLQNLIQLILKALEQKGFCEENSKEGICDYERSVLKVEKNKTKQK